LSQRRGNSRGKERYGKKRDKKEGKKDISQTKQRILKYVMSSNEFWCVPDLGSGGRGVLRKVEKEKNPVIDLKRKNLGKTCKGGKRGMTEQAIQEKEKKNYLRERKLLGQKQHRKGEKKTLQGSPTGGLKVGCTMQKRT